MFGKTDVHLASNPGNEVVCIFGKNVRNYKNDLQPQPACPDTHSFLKD